jgi:hypothetical protein
MGEKIFLKKTNGYIDASPKSLGFMGAGGGSYGFDVKLTL